MEKISATIFVNGRGTSIVTTKEEIIKEINHFRLFWMANIMEKSHDGTYTAHYSNEEKRRSLQSMALPMSYANGCPCA